MLPRIERWYRSAAEGAKLEVASLAVAASLLGSTSAPRLGPPPPASKPMPVLPGVQDESLNPVRAVHVVPGPVGTRTFASTLPAINGTGVELSAPVPYDTSG